MGKIKQLSLHEAQKIAAGEVVERPANVIKELVENSIDAGAQRITISIEHGGHTLIRVVDNGSGMAQDDAQKCFDHHATSKITTVDDLSSISSFGFRGEALASISAVSKVSLITKQPESTHGIKLTRSENTIGDLQEISCASGTDITIEDLFYNVPARKKFLKTTTTEIRQVTQLFQAFCFSYINLHFTLYSENKEVYNCPPAKKLLDRVNQLWDNNSAQHMLTLKSLENKHVKITGIASDHQWYRYDRNHQFFFVNNRWIKNQPLARALLKGYLNVIPQGRFPAAVICLQIDPHQVDINVHPRKQEVQFLHPRIIETCIQKTIKESLEQNLSQRIQKPATFSTTEDEPFTVPIMQPIEEHNTKQTHSPAPFTFTSPRPTIDQPIIDFDTLPFQDKINPTPLTKTIEPEAQQQFITSQPEVPLQLLGQFKKTYILAEDTEGLFVVDQHAAHERILYEQFRKRFGELPTVKLLFPQIVKLTTAESQTLNPYIDLLAKHGVVAESFGNNQLIIQSTPVHLKNASFNEIIKEVIGLISEFHELPQQDFHKTLHEKIHAQMACKAAVKAGDELTHEKMQQLLTDLSQTENRFACPHGRPTFWLLTMHEIEKKFKRKL